MKDNQIKISIILPVYNVENYIRRCVDSVIEQEEKNWELLIINDGSSDNSPKLCNYYAGIDNRIHVFHKENGGVSSARNLGLSHARGQWILFLDADDWLSKDFLTIEKDDEIADVIHKSWIRSYENGDKEVGTVIGERNVIVGRDSIYSYYVKYANNALWNKIILKKIIGDKRFDTDITIGEDFLFFCSILKDVSTYILSSKGKYFYYIRKSSAMGLLNKKKMHEKVNISINNVRLLYSILNDYKYKALRDGLFYSLFALNLIRNYMFLSNENQLFLRRKIKNVYKAELSYLSCIMQLKLFLGICFFSIKILLLKIKNKKYENY